MKGETCKYVKDTESNDLKYKNMCVFLFLGEKVAHLPTVFVIFFKNLTVLQNIDH